MANAWWNNPVETQQQAAPAQQAPPPPAPVAEPTPAVADIVRREMVTQAEAYQKWADERRGQYEQATAKFKADATLAPYYSIAEKFFTQANLESNQRRPVGDLFDSTVLHIKNLIQMGVKPPVQTQSRGGFSNGGQNWESPMGVDGNPRPMTGYRNQDPAVVRQQQDEYLKARRLDFELRKDRTTPADDIVNSIVGKATSSMHGLNLQAN